MTTLDKLREQIAGGRNKLSRRIANNTTARLIDEGKGVAVKLHDTDVVVWNNDSTITLNSGGWLSKTTKERINTYSPAQITQRAGIWYMKDGSLFYDGMQIRVDGTPIKPHKTGAYEKKLKAIKTAAKAYAKDYVAALQAGLIDYPNGGDCWFCLMFDKGGDLSSDHIKQHMKEKYYVPSLLVNAGRSAGYQDMQIGLMGIGGQRVFIEPDRILYKYIVKRLQKDL